MSQSINIFAKAKNENRLLSLCTCYDSWSAQLIAESSIDAILVGDSVAMVMHGHDNTLAATTEMMAMHVSAVSRGVNSKKHVIGDLPFLSYRKGLSAAMESVEDIMRAGAHSVKLEGTWGHEDVIKNIIGSGVPVMGHIGLTPQSIHGLGGFKVQGRGQDQADDLVKQAQTLQELGCYSLVLECVPSAVAQKITALLDIPTIGIGAGVDCDGQILVLQDLLGFNKGFKPKFLRTFFNGAESIEVALENFCQEVKNKNFPNAEESY